MATQTVCAFWRRDKFLAFAGIRNAGRSTSSLVSISTMLSWFTVEVSKLIGAPIRNVLASRPTQPSVHLASSLFPGLKRSGRGAEQPCRSRTVVECG